MAENQFLRQNLFQPPKHDSGPRFGDILPINIIEVVRFVSNS